MTMLKNEGDAHSPTADDCDRDARLDEAVTDWLKAIEQNVVDQDSGADRQAWFERYPQLQGELAEFFADEGQLARLTTPLREVLRSIPPPIASGVDAETLIWHGGHTRFPVHIAGRAFGEYELLAEIARGGMGVVYKARQTRLNRTVAIKMILSGQFAGRDDVRRFLAEAEAAAGLDHPGIVPVYGCGQIEGQHFFSMGFVEGQSLAVVLAEGPLPPRRAAELLAQVVDAVAYAHSRGVIHRDLKPSNILIAHDGHPRVSDFGLAKTAAGDSGLTRSGDVIGTPGYMPPEQAAGRLADIGPASDVYALGAVLYAMLTVRPPFQAANALDTLSQVLEREPLAPRQLNPAVPRDLETIVLTCLQKDPRRRYATADALAAELRRFLRGEPIHARPVGRVERGWRWCRRNRAVAGLTASVAALLVAATIVSTMAAFRLRAEQNRTSENLHRAERAEHDALDKLRDSYLAQARAQRVSGACGQRFESLKALSEAAALRGGADLRDEAIACLALTDLRPARRWPGYANGATALTFDRAFQRYARSDSDGKLQVRSVAGDRLLFELPSPGPGEHVWILSFSPDGRHLAAMHHPHSIIHVWHLDTKSLVLNRHVGRSFHFHPDGRLIAFADHADGAVTIYDLSAGKVVARFAPGATPSSFAFDPQGDRIAITLATPPCIGVFDLETQRRERTLLVDRLPPATTTRLAFSPNGRLIAATRTDNQVYVCDVATGSVQAVLRGHQDRPTDAVFNAAGNLLATSGWDGTVRFWDPYAGRQLLIQEGAAGYQSARFSDDDQLFGPTISGSEVALWRVATGGEACASLCRPSGGAPVIAAEFSRDSRLLATLDNRGGVHLWSVAGRECLASLPVNAASIAFDRAGDSLLIAGDSGLHRWPIREQPPAEPSGRAQSELHVGPPESLDMPGGLSCVTLDALGHTIAVAVPATGQAFIMREDGTRVALERPEPDLRHIALSPDGRRLASGAWFGSAVNRPKVWNAVTGKLERELATGLRSGDCVCFFSGDGHWLATSNSAQEVRCWRAGSWRPGPAMERTFRRLAAPAFHPLATLLAVVSSPNLVEFVGPADGARQVSLLAAGPRAISGVTFDPFGQYLAARRGDLLQLWDLAYLRRELRALGFDGSGLGPGTTHEAPPLPAKVVVER